MSYYFIKRVPISCSFRVEFGFEEVKLKWLGRYSSFLFIKTKDKDLEKSPYNVVLYHCKVLL